jgi:murein DD-endopeptidase MepM/ murein hydrolase activator NlpD
MNSNGARARSHTHGRRKGRNTVHALVIVMALSAVGFAARYPGSEDASALTLVPTFSLSGVSGGTGRLASTAFFRPGSSSLTRESIKALNTVSDVASVRAAGGVSPISSFSSGVTAAAAASGESEGGLRPLADIVDPRQPFVLYEPLPGDTVSGIAERYGISVRTLLDNNPTVKDVNLVQRGQQLVVPRKDGILYKVAHGDTVDKIVGQYDEITSGTVIEYRPNAITDPKSLKTGDFILLPGAKVKPPPPLPPAPPARTGSGPGVGTAGAGSAPPAAGAGLFKVAPVASWRSVSDEFGVPRGGGSIHTGTDLDLHGYAFMNVFSVCDGVVARTEYLTYSYGYHVVVDCGDGWSTLYAHFSEITVSPGQQVSAGTVIGVTGLTGFTTGHHLHFEVRKNGAPVNPEAYFAFR